MSANQVYTFKKVGSGISPPHFNMFVQHGKDVGMDYLITNSVYTTMLNRELIQGTQNDGRFYYIHRHQNIYGFNQAKSFIISFYPLC